MSGRYLVDASAMFGRGGIFFFFAFFPTLAGSTVPGTFNWGWGGWGGVAGGGTRDGGSCSCCHDREQGRLNFLSPPLPPFSHKEESQKEGGGEKKGKSINFCLSLPPLQYKRGGDFAHVLRQQQQQQRQQQQQQQQQQQMGGGGRAFSTSYNHLR